MLLTEILYSNIIHFFVITLSSFSFFAAGLLYYDSWKVSKNKKTPLFRSLGFLLLSLATLSYLFSTYLSFMPALIELITILALIIIYYSLVKEPILNKPAAMFIPLNLAASYFSLLPLSFVLHLLVSATYLRKYKEGLEKQLWPAGLSFVFLSLRKLAELGFYWRDTTNISLSKIFVIYGPLWYLEHLLLFIGSVILLVWAWSYIRFRIQAQLFVTTVGISLIIFLTTTFLYSYLLLSNLQKDILSSLETNGRVFTYALERVQFESISNSRSIASDSTVQQTLEDNNREDLLEISRSFLLSQNSSFIDIVNQDGTVVVRAHNPDKYGDSLLYDPTISSALNGQQLATIYQEEGVISPTINIKSSYPIESDDNLVGAVSSGFEIDNSFVDGIKEVTGLDVSIYAGNTRVATTFTSSDETTRSIGALETNQQVLQQVLTDGQVFSGTIEVINQPYFGSYIPLKTLNDEIIGMLFLGKPQLDLINTAQEAIENTYLASAMLILLSLAPAYLYSKYLNSQLEA